jgi:hypothetical protein
MILKLMVGQIVGRKGVNLEAVISLFISELFWFPWRVHIRGKE